MTTSRLVDGLDGWTYVMGKMVLPGGDPDQFWYLTSHGCIDSNRYYIIITCSSQESFLMASPSAQRDIRVRRASDNSRSPRENLRSSPMKGDNRDKLCAVSGLSGSHFVEANVPTIALPVLTSTVELTRFPPSARPPPTSNVASSESDGVLYSQLVLPPHITGHSPRALPL